MRFQFERQQRDGDGDDGVAEEDDAVDVAGFLLALALLVRFVEREAAVALICAGTQRVAQAAAVDQPRSLSSGVFGFAALLVALDLSTYAGPSSGRRSDVAQRRSGPSRTSSVHVHGAQSGATKATGIEARKTTTGQR